METNPTLPAKRWYDNRVLVNVLLFLFFPVGLFGLWKSRTIAMWWKVGGTALIALWVFAVVFSDNKKGESNSPTLAAKPLTEVEKKQLVVDQQAEVEAAAKERAENTISAEQLVASYQDNEVKADQNFKNKTFFVTGTVNDIKKDIMDDIYVTLEGDGILSQVQCFIEDEAVAANLSKGQKVTIKGTCNGLMMNVLMKECSVVE